MVTENNKKACMAEEDWVRETIVGVADNEDQEEW